MTAVPTPEPRGDEMSGSDLSLKTCTPCKGGVPPLTEDEARKYLDQVEGWELVEGRRIRRDFEFPDFIQALAAANRIGALAEEQGHHPDLHLAWGRLGVEIWTHKIDGLTESDFILAAKINDVV
jgi:4a-hydroxytetrahydrobiopterin dehydratase